MRRLAYFVAASLLAHLVGIYGVQIELPRRAAEPLPLEVQLQATVPPPRVLPRPRPRPPAMHQPSTAAVAT
ncbi:MAG: energy transducer TonB, partial [Betaproteobacteria bacterium]|nr:energy transducer TonB [Betaproteobacteria bacterium]